MNNLVCSLSGESPIPDPVCTPCGHICSKRLLLSKLSETNGSNPFSPPSPTSKPLAETDLIPLPPPSSHPPPRLPSPTSIPSLLTALQSSYDSLVLELYDTRKALEETRRELSESLYQNDAAVRVVARVVLERDLARRELVESVGGGPSGEGAEGGGKRRRVDVDAVDVVPPADDEMEDAEVGPAPPSPSPSPSPAEGPSGTIPPSDAVQLEATWKQLSSERKKTLKAKKRREKLRQQNPSQHKDDDNDSDDKCCASIDSIRAWECTLSKNLHKASFKAGLFALRAPAPSAAAPSVEAPTPSPSAFLVSSARDKQLIFYDTAGDKIVHRQTIKTYVHSHNLDCYLDRTTGQKLVACVGEDSLLRVYATRAASQTEDQDGWLSTQVPVPTHPSADNLTVPDVVVGVCVHPTGSHIFVVTSNGKIHFYSVARDKPDHDNKDDSGGLTVTPAAVFQDTGADVAKCSSIGLHPDGLILATGRGDGKVALWDLKTQNLASVLEGSTNSKISAISFSENGYHIATSTTSGTVTIWDLRKQNTILSLQSPTTQNSDDEPSSSSNNNTFNAVRSLAFCPTGSFLAYGTSNGEIVITPVGKTKGESVVLDGSVVENKKGKGGAGEGGGGGGGGAVCGLVWRDGAMGLASCNESERGIKFWGVSVKDP